LGTAAGRPPGQAAFRHSLMGLSNLSHLLAHTVHTTVFMYDGIN
jgi:hypothetical protein